jgi:hypothetical protein
VHLRGGGAWPDATPGRVDPVAARVWPVNRGVGALDIAERIHELRQEGRLKALIFVSVVSVKWWKSRDASSARVTTLLPDLPSACPSIRRVL